MVLIIPVLSWFWCTGRPAWAAAAGLAVIVTERHRIFAALCNPAQNVLMQKIHASRD